MQHESNAAAAASPEKNEGPCAEANDGGRGVLGLSRLENTRKQRQRLEQAIVNGARARSSRSLYDALLFHRENVEMIQETTGKLDVTAHQLQDLWHQASLNSPSIQTLTKWKKAVFAVSEEAFEALGEVYNMRDEKVDPSAISLNFLTKREFIELRKKPPAQLLAIYIMARYRRSNNVVPRIVDGDTVIEHAYSGAVFRKRIETSLPRSSWSKAFNQAVDGMTCGALSTEDFQTYVIEHIALVDDDVADVRESLAGQAGMHAIMKEYETVAMGRIPRRLELSAAKDKSLRRLYQEWEQRYSDIRAAVGKARPDEQMLGQEKRKKMSPDEKDDFDMEQEKETEGKETGREVDDGCQDGIRDTGSCCTETADESVEKLTSRSTERGPVSRRKQERNRPGDGFLGQQMSKIVADLPTEPATVSLKSSRSGGAYVREISAFLQVFQPLQGRAPLPVCSAPKLIVVSIDAERSMMETSDVSDTTLKGFLGRVLQTLHPCGTVAIGLPRPWLKHSARIRDIFVDDGSMSVEESPLLLRYNPKSEEQARVAGHGLASNSHEAVLLAHKVPAARGSECTINWRVTLNDPYGRSKEEYPVFWNYMGGLEYPTDVRAGDPRCTFPARLLPVLVNRFTAPGDTVLGIGVESTSLPEVALKLGRRVELILADQSTQREVQDRIVKAYRKAVSRGRHQHDADPWVVVGPSRLPAGLPRDTTPDEFRADGDDGSVKATMKRAVKKFGYTIRFNRSTVMHELFVKQKKGDARSRMYGDIPLWGSLEVHDSPYDAKDTLSKGELADQAFRLVLVATNRQLRCMLDPQKETCCSEAALYMRVAATCPFYWLGWDTIIADDSDAFEIVSNIPREGTRTSLLDAVRGSADGATHALHASVRKRSSDTTARREGYPVTISPSNYVVGGLQLEPFLRSCRKRKASGDESGPEHESLSNGGGYDP